MNHSWVSLGILSKANLTPYNKKIGVYKAVLYGKIMYIGRAIEYNNGGFRKRLADYTRKSNSGRKHKSGKFMNENSSALEIYIIDIININVKNAVNEIKDLEKSLICKYKPCWNEHFK